MRERFEITHLDGTVEFAEGDDVRVVDGVLHIWYFGYNTGRSALDGEHAGSWPLTSIKRWKQLQP